MQTTIQKLNNQVIITFPKVETKDCCSLCSATPKKNSRIKDITKEDGILMYSLARRTNKHNFCQGCRNSMKNITNDIVNNIIDNRLSFHTVELPLYGHYDCGHYIKGRRNHFNMPTLKYLKPDAPSTLKVLENKHTPYFQLDSDPYTLEEYKGWDKTSKMYDLWNEREERVYEENKDRVITQAIKEYPEALDNAEVEFFIRLSKRIK